MMGNWPGPLGIDQPTAGHSSSTRLYGKEAGCKLRLVMGEGGRGGVRVLRANVESEVKVMLFWSFKFFCFWIC